MLHWKLLEGRKMLTAQIEPFKNVLPAMKEYFQEHYKEVSRHNGKFPLSPLYEVYAAREEANQVITGTLREDGVLVGYYVGFIAPGMHYSTCLTCTTDIFYVAKPLRKTGAGKLLMEEVERELKNRGVKLWTLSAKVNTPAIKLIEAIGGELTESLYLKWV